MSRWQIVTLTLMAFFCGHGLGVAGIGPTETTFGWKFYAVLWAVGVLLVITDVGEP